MQKARIFFKKQGRAKYISHLDLSRAFQRALKRSELPVWYTEGFHPHIYITFALPLSLGAESECEAADFRLETECTAEQILTALAPQMPEGLEVFAVSEGKTPVADIGYCNYTAQVEFGEEKNLNQLFEEFINLHEIPVEKNSKKGKKVVDIKPFIEVRAAEFSENTARLELCLPAGSAGFNVNPALVLEAFAKFAGLTAESTQITRTAILTLQKTLFE